jgi:hypothetical protein
MSGQKPSSGHASIVGERSRSILQTSFAYKFKLPCGSVFFSKQETQKKKKKEDSHSENIPRKKKYKCQS